MLMSDTKLIGFWTVLAFLLLSPIIAIVYTAYSFGFWMHRRDMWLVKPFAVFFAILNTAHNWTVCTILFREFPREFFTTDRLKRWKGSEDLSRRELADLLGGFLNSQDPGHY